jgi:nicotinate-nucleotide--dimethylbenzimidazole phosphoribosyltransferase
MVLTKSKVAAMNFNIHKPDVSFSVELKRKIDMKTKPVGALGKLEALALQIGLIQQTLNPVLIKPSILVLAADHGIANEGVSAYPQEVTHQMVLNFLSGGAAINVFCKQNNISLKVVDAGVNFDFYQSGEELINAKIAYGTASFLKEAAMSQEQCMEALANGVSLIDQLQMVKKGEQSCNCVGFGEMGIGNTSSAAVLMSVLCNFPIEDCVGRGTGLNNEQVENKIKILKRAIEKGQPLLTNIYDTLAYFGGFEIATMVGAMLRAAELKMLLIVDGFISTAAFLVAHQISPNIIHYAIFSHQSDEKGHGLLLRYMGADPVLNLNMRLGEGTGCALVYPIIEAAVNFLNQMASFRSAGVSFKE